MITNTCFTGGSFEVAPVDGDPEDPFSPLLERGEEDLLLAVVFVDPGPDAEERFAGVGACAAVGAGAGVSSDTDGGGSLAAADAEGVELEGAAGRISFRGGRADAANVSSTRDPVTSPSIAPKPKNTSTSSTHTLGEGRVRPGLTSTFSTRLTLERQRRRQG